MFALACVHCNLMSSTRTETNQSLILQMVYLSVQMIWISQELHFSFWISGSQLCSPDWWSWVLDAQWTCQTLNSEISPNRRDGSDLEPPSCSFASCFIQISYVSLLFTFFNALYKLNLYQLYNPDDSFILWFDLVL